MSKVAATSGGFGDIVYAIPIMRELKIKTVYVKENWYVHPEHSLYSGIKTLLEHEGFNVLPTKGGYDPMKYEHGLKFDYDLDSFRKMSGRGFVHIQKNMRMFFNLELKPFSPWLSLPVSDYGYSVIHLTERWRENSLVEWEHVLSGINQKVYFIGFQYEWLDFQIKYGDIEWKQCYDILDMAKFISGASAVYCNQSVALTLAQGLGKKYFLDKKPGKTNTLMYTKNEHLL